MTVLMFIFVFVGIVLFTATYLSRKNKREEVEIKITENPECCGAHEVCERDNLQIINPVIEYFDDEELDVLSGIIPENYTDAQIQMISDVFYSMRESDVAPWLRSLQLRNIGLPATIREQALMIVGERRS